MQPDAAADRNSILPTIRLGRRAQERRTGQRDPGRTMSSVETSPPRPRWERRKEARPAELLSAALDLFVEKGYAGTRLDDVAARAGVSKGTLYLYFQNKEELFKAVVRENIVTALVETAQEMRDFDGPTAELLRNLI